MARSPRAHLQASALALSASAVLVIILACADAKKPEAPPAPAVAAPTGCAKDADCKGDRVCEKGACISPR